MRISIVALTLLISLFSTTNARAQEIPDLEILQAFAADFERDPMLTEPWTFGVRVGEAMYTIAARPASADRPADVSARAGAPGEPTFHYTVESREYLQKLHHGEMAALTLMARAFDTDVTPMDIEFDEGFEPPEGFGAKLLPMTFHFWTRGGPEVVPFGPDRTVRTHGTNAGIFYYQPGFRSGWFNIEPGDRVNEDEASRTNPFPSMMIMVDGEVTALIGEEETTFREGTMMLIPAGVSHRFVNDGDAAAFGFLFMFGEGA